MSQNGIPLPKGDGTNYLYKRPNCTLESLIQEYVLSYSCTTIKRTGAYGGSAPIGITKILQAIAVASSKLKSKDDFIRCTALLGDLTKHYKTSLGTHGNVCRLSAQPFPLIRTGKQPDKYTETLEFVPLYDESTGQFASDRYSHVNLSTLGEIAFKDCKDIPIDQLKYHKGIVPIALLRKGLAWALGHHSTMYSMNPGELFKLQERMLELNTPYLPSEIVMDIFRGPDLGKNYTIYMTNDSLASLYASGTGSMMVVPDIEIDRVNNQIRFLRPPLDSTGKEFASHMIRRLLGGQHKNSSGKLTEYEQFETISLNPDRDGAFISGSSIIADVIFNTADDKEIIDELHSDRYIYRNVPLQNILLKTEDGTHIQTDEEDLDSTADFNIDISPIYELLWEHIGQEIDVRRRKYIRRYNDLEEQLKWDIFLEKVTRPEVSNKIMEIWNETHINKETYLRRNKLIELFLNEETRDKELLPEGFNDLEISEIARTNASNSNTGLVIINIMSDRKKYEDRWISTLAERDRLKGIIDDETNMYIREEIRIELSVYTTKYREFDRKSKVYFIEPIGKVEEELSTFMMPDDARWNEHKLPCTLYYNNSRIVKSYGRNFNVMLMDEYDKPENYPFSLNVTNNDYILMFGYNLNEYYMSSVREFSSTPTQLQTNIRTIIPCPMPGEKMLINIGEMVEVNGVKDVMYTKFHILDGDNLVIPSLKSSNEILSYCYLDKEYVQTSLMFHGKMMVATLRTEDIINSTREVPYKVFPRGVVIVDLITTDDSPGLYNLSQNDETDVTTVRDSITTWKTFIPSILDAEKKNIKSPYFVRHLEFYADNVYVPWLMDTFILSLHTFPTNKWMVLSEPHYCHPKDTTSKKIKESITNKIKMKESKVRVIMTNMSKAYQDFKISDIDDWTLIDPRYRIPTDKPVDDQEKLDSFDNYFRELNRHKISDKDYIKLEKSVRGLRTVKKDVDIKTLKSSSKVIKTEILEETFESDDEEFVGIDD